MASEQPTGNDFEGDGKALEDQTIPVQPPPRSEEADPIVELPPEEIVQAPEVEEQLEEAVDQHISKKR